MKHRALEQGTTLLEVVAATVILALISGALLTVLRLGSRTTTGFPPGYLKSSTIHPRLLSDTTPAHPAWSATDLDGVSLGTPGQGVRWLEVETLGFPNQGCLRLVVTKNPSP